MERPLNVFIGYDPAEHDAYLVAKSSLERHTEAKVLVSPLDIMHLSHLLPPPIRGYNNQLWDWESDAPQSTEFARSRFCVPFLQKAGWAVFMDCDVVIQADIRDLFARGDPDYAVMVVQHDYEAINQRTDGTKMGDKAQTAYKRKLWSSVMLWNCSHPAHRRLTKERLNIWPGRDLHAFKWLEEKEIGMLDHRWNHLVGIDPADRAAHASILHYTLGGPFIENWEPAPLDWIWDLEYAHLREGRKVIANTA